MYRSDLVVRGHDGDEDRPIVERLAQLLEIEEPGRVDAEVRHMKAATLELLRGVEHGRMLRDAGDDPVAMLSMGLGRPEKSNVVRLRGPGRPDDLLRRRIDEQGRLLPGALDRPLCLPPIDVVTARCVSELLVEVREHLLDDPWVARRGRVGVEVDGAGVGHRTSPVAGSAGGKLFCRGSGVKTIRESRRSARWPESRRPIGYSSCSSRCRIDIRRPATGSWASVSAPANHLDAP
jgi:hypothetical protein